MRKVRFVLLSILCTFLLNSCGMIPEVELTEEETALVAEYAAGALLKYDGQHHNGLMEITNDPIIVETPTPPPPAAGEEQNGMTEGADESNLIAEQTASLLPLAAALGIPDFFVTYTGYETCDIYPEQESDDLVFSMQAQTGHDLLILHFDLNNPTESAMDCDIVTNAPLFRLLINDDMRINCQTTILLNDLSVYKGTLEGNETTDTVLVFEIEEATTAELSKLSLLLVGDDNDFTYQLQ